MTTMTRLPKVHVPTEDSLTPGFCTCGLQMTRFNWRHQDPDNVTVILMEQRTHRSWYGDTEEREEDTPYLGVS